MLQRARLWDSRPMTRPLVLVTGGAGFLGVPLCRFLLAQGFAVRSLDSRASGSRAVDSIQGDIRDAALVAQAMRGVGYVVHAAAAAPTASPDTLYSTGVLGTWNVLEAALRNRVSRMVFVSSSAVYGIHEHHLMHEADELHGYGAYAESKIEAEHLSQGARLNGLCVPILRCADMIGQGRPGVFERLYRLAARGRHVPILGSGQQPCQAVDVEDVCEAIYLCLVMRASLVNDTFNLGAADFATVRDSFQAVLDSTGYGKRVVSLPAAPAAAVSTLLESLRLGSLCPWSGATVGVSSYLSMRHIEVKLDFRPRHSARAALVRNFLGYQRSHQQPGARRAALAHSARYEGLSP